MLSRITAAFILLYLISPLTLAQDTKWLYPEPYSKGFHILNDEIFYNLKESNQDATFIIGINGVASKWLTKCYQEKEKGILVPQCMVQNIDTAKEDEKSIVVLVSKDKSTVVFRPIVVVEINYKVDKNQIITLDKYYLMTPSIQRKILKDLLVSNDVIYSYKVEKSKNYRTNKVDLTGFKENIEFANRFVDLNY